MKKVLLYTLSALAIAAALGLQSCNKLKDAIPAQDVTFTNGGDITLPAASDTTAQGTLGQVAVYYNLDSMISAQTDGKLGYGNIQTVKITNIQMTLTDADATNSFANFVYAGGAFNSDVNGNNTPYTIAFVDNNPDTYNTALSPTVVDAGKDLKQYFNSQMTFYYLLVGKLRHATTKTLHCHVEVTYVINVKA